MFLLQDGQVTGPYDPAQVVEYAKAKRLPVGTMAGPSAQGPWTAVYPPEGPKQFGCLQSFVIIAIGSVMFTAVLVMWGNTRKDPSVIAPPPPTSPPAPAEPVAAPSDGKAGFRRTMCPLKAFPCSVGGPDSTVMTIENGIGCPITATAFVKDPKPLNDMGFLVVRCPTGQEWRAPTFARAK